MYSLICYLILLAVDIHLALKDAGVRIWVIVDHDETKDNTAASVG